MTKNKSTKYITNLYQIPEEEKIGNFFLKSSLNLKSGFGDIYVVLDKNEDELILKIQKKKIKKNHLMNEYKIYEHLKHSKYVSNYFNYFETGLFKCLVINKYDIDLKDLYHLDIKKYDVFYKKKILFQIFNILEDIHDKMIVHQDIKLTNFTYNYLENKVYLIDFGSSYIQTNEYENNGKLVGTLIYASLNAHRSIKLNYYDDIESLLYSYIEIELYKQNKKFSWRGLSTKKHSNVERWNRVYFNKKDYLINNYLYDNLPYYLIKLIHYYIHYKKKREKQKRNRCMLKVDYTKFKKIVIKY